MRQYEGVVGIAEIKDPYIRRNLFMIDRFLKQISAAGIEPGQPTATGAGGGGAACCPNQVDEFERTNDATEGILAFGRAEAEAAVPPSATHNIVRIEGWEHNFQTGTLMGGDQSSGAGVSTVTTHHGSGSYALQMVYSAVATNFVDLGIGFASTGRSSTTARTTVGYRVWINITSLPAATAKIFSLISGATERSILQLSNAGHLILDGITGPSTLAINTWYEITGKYDSAATGRVDVQIATDSTSRTTEFSNVTPTANGTVTILRIGTNGSNQAWTCLYDDVCLEADATTLAYPPAGQVRAMTLTADGNIADSWSITGAATRWQACANPHDGDTSYISVSNVGVRRQTFVQALPSSIGQTINAVQFNNVMRQTPGSGGACRIIIAATNTSNVADLTEIATGDTATTVFGLRAACRQTNPFTSGTWTRAALTAMVIGCYSNPNGAAEVHRQSTVVTTIDVGMDVAGDYARAIRVTADEGYVIPAFLVTDGAVVDTNSRARIVAGYDGANAQFLLTDTSGRLITTLVPGSGPTDLGKAEDAGHASGDVGVMALAVRSDTAAATAANGDYEPLLVDSTGRLHVNTELPDAAALADAVANPTTPVIAAYVHAKGSGATTYSRVSSELANANDDGDTSDRGIHISDQTKYFQQTLTALNTAYDTNPTETNSSATIDCSRFRRFMFFWTVTKNNTPTDIQVKAEFSIDGGTTWFQYRNNFWGQLLYDDVAVGSGFSRCYSGDCIGGPALLRFTIVATGLTGGGGGNNNFTVAGATVVLLN